MCSLSVALVCGRPVKEYGDLLRDLGYLEDGGQYALQMTGGSVLRAYQRDHRLAKTGKLDLVTERTLTSPRCGVTPAVKRRLRLRRYVTMGSRWEKIYVTYSKDQNSANYTKEFVDEVRRAFDAWNAVSNLKAYQARPGEVADIRIRWGSGWHNCSSLQSFHSGSPVLAHAFEPQHGGEIHVNDFVDFRTYQLSTCMAHEVGHALGLDHSADVNSVMYFQYRTKLPVDRILGEEDRKGIEALYGRPV